ncbi:MAG: permease-like cell division protein FtsX [Bacteroidota bacterium]
MSLVYIFREGLAGFRRAKLAAVGSVLTITIALLLLGLFYIVSTNTSRIVDSIRAKVQMETFLEEPVSRQRIVEIKQQLLAIEGVADAQFISKEEAAKIFKQEFGEDINKVLEFNPLPPSFKIFLKEDYRTTERADEIHKRIKRIKGVDDVVYRKDLLEFIDKRAATLYAVGLVVGIFISISAIFLVSNTIRLTIYAKRKAIQTMKLVGASRWMVRAPFLIEGITQGIIGGLIATGLLYYMMSLAAKLLSDELAEFLQVDVLFYVFTLAVGLFLGLLGSSISVRRFIGETVVQ